MSENKPRILLRDFANEIANSYQESLKTEEGIKKAERINKKRTGSTIGEIDKEGSAKRHKEHVIDLMNKYLAALGVKEYSHYFKGGMGEDGKLIREDSYAFYIEDKELVKKILNTGRKGGFIQKGKFDKTNIETLREIINDFEILFKKYCKNKKDLEDITRTMHGVSRIDVRAELSKIQKDIKDYIMQMKLNPNFDEFAEYLITEEDYILWIKQFKRSISILIKAFMAYWEEIESYRKQEYIGKREALYESEIEEFNDFVEKLGEKAVQKGIVKNPEDIISKNGVILCERDIAILKNRKKLKECITELEQYPGYKIYNKLIERKPSEEILQEVCKSIELNDFVGKNGIELEIERQIERLMENDALLTGKFF